MSFKTLVTTETLSQHLEDPNWVIVDCRFDLSNPGFGFSQYQQAHIPGAIYTHLDQDLSGPVTPFTGRHPLPDNQEFMQRLSSWGIDAGKQVVIYDTSGGSFAARLWCMLRGLGHQNVAVLDGGFPKWVREMRPTRSGIEQREPSQFFGHPVAGFYIDADEVDRIREDSRYRLIDARSPERYRGEQEPIDPVAGRIPGALNRFHGENLEEDGTFRKPDELRREFEALLEGVSPDLAVVYCGSGVTSCHHLLAMEYAGIPGGKLYVGSWSEWIRDPTRSRASG